MDKKSKAIAWMILFLISTLIVALTPPIELRWYLFAGVVFIYMAGATYIIFYIKEDSDGSR